MLSQQLFMNHPIFRDRLTDEPTDGTTDMTSYRDAKKNFLLTDEKDMYPVLFLIQKGCQHCIAILEIQRSHCTTCVFYAILTVSKCFSSAVMSSGATLVLIELQLLETSDVVVVVVVGDAPLEPSAMAELMD